jgi:glycosyltransferase involved in cell wall biosynthesis
MDRGTELSFLKRRPFSDSLADLEPLRATRSWTAEWTGVSEWSLDRRLHYYASTCWKTAETAFALPRDVSATGADVFFTPDPQAVAISDRFRTVAVVYDLIPLLFPQHYLPRIAAVDRLTYSYSLHGLRRAHHLVAISQTTKNDAVRLLGLAPEKISVVALAADAGIFREQEPAAARTYVARQFGVEDPYFIYLGGFDHRKNVPSLVAAMASVPEPVKLVIAGPMKGPGARLRQEVDASSLRTRVVWLDFVPVEELPALYAASLALAFPSLYEGFGLPVLEAMSCGAPVLTSPTSSLPEVAGDAALYADPTSPSELAAALRRLAREPELRDELRSRGLERAQQFSWTKSAEQILEICRATAEAG